MWMQCIHNGEVISAEFVISGPGSNSVLGYCVTFHTDTVKKVMNLSLLPIPIY